MNNKPFNIKTIKKRNRISERRKHENDDLAFLTHSFFVSCIDEFYDEFLAKISDSEPYRLGFYS